jgi:hypothetical protein
MAKEDDAPKTLGELAQGKHEDVAVVVQQIVKRLGIGDSYVEAAEPIGDVQAHPPNIPVGEVPPGEDKAVDKERAAEAKELAAEAEEPVEA